MNTKILVKPGVDGILSQVKSKNSGFCEIMKKNPMNSKTLSERLKSLCTEGVLEKKVLSGSFPMRTEYSMTPRGAKAWKLITELNTL